LSHQNRQEYHPSTGSPAAKNVDNSQAEKLLRILAPFLRAELGSLGFPSHAPSADDLFQETMIRIWQVLKSRDGILEFPYSYAKKVVYSVFLNAVRKLQRDHRILMAAEHEHRLNPRSGKKDPDPSRIIPGSVMDALSSLSGPKGRVLSLVLQGLTLEEIAQLNHWALGKVRTCYYRGLAELRARLVERGIRYER
jgi:RNA polymerase sigma factor (sigma-70 family)